MLGLETNVTIGKQSSVAIPTTLARRTVSVYTISGGQTQGNPADPILGAPTNNTFDPTLPGPGLTDHKLMIEFPLCTTQLGSALSAFFGGEVLAGSAAPYTHTFTSGGTPPYYFIEHQLTTGIYRQHSSCVAESLDIDFNSEQEGYAKVSVGFIGLQEAPSSVTLPGSVVSEAALARPPAALANISYNGASGGVIMAAKLSFKRPLKRVRAADGTGVPYDVQQQGYHTIDGSLHIRYKDETLNADAIAETARQIIFSSQYASGQSFALTLYNARLARTGIDIKGPDGVELDMAFSAWQTASSPACVTVLTNGFGVLYN